MVQNSRFRICETTGESWLLDTENTVLRYFKEKPSAWLLQLRDQAGHWSHMLLLTFSKITRTPARFRDVSTFNLRTRPCYWVGRCNSRQDQEKLIFSHHHVHPPAKQRMGKEASASSTPRNPQFHLSLGPPKPSWAPKLRHKVVPKSCCAHACHTRVCCESFTRRCEKAELHRMGGESISNDTPRFLNLKVTYSQQKAV